MSDPYERAKGGRLAFKGGVLATRATKSSIDKKKKKKKKQHNQDQDVDAGGGGIEKEEEEEEEGGMYTIDAAKRMKYDELFPVEAKKFGYDPKSAASNSKSKSVEEALDDRVKKKADRYCK